jgi:hypothetical protein
MAALKRVYFDSTIFVDMVKTDLGKAIDADREADVWMAKRLMEAHRDKEIQVLTSTLTIAECTHGGDGDISEQAQSLMSKLLTSGDYVHLVEMTPFIATDARDLRWKHNINLKGADGVHAASALSRQCAEAVTTNGRFGRLHVHQDAFAALGLRIIHARDSQLLPNKYRQLGLGDAIH